MLKTGGYTFPTQPENQKTVEQYQIGATESTYISNINTPRRYPGCALYVDNQGQDVILVAGGSGLNGEGKLSSVERMVKTSDGFVRTVV